MGRSITLHWVGVPGGPEKNCLLFFGSVTMIVIHWGLHGSELFSQARPRRIRTISVHRRVHLVHVGTSTIRSE